jgi:16S rRNA (guanine(966)-N(2))-methyltransferase RsmD
MRTQLRIVAGILRGRKLTCNVNPNLRPAPQRVREALFSILGDAIPDRPFFDLFAGTGAVGLEALSRGAQRVTLVERDLRTAAEIERHADEFGVGDRTSVVRADTYRWVEHWHGLQEPANVFVGPPFRDIRQRLDSLLLLIADLQQKLAPGSILVVQNEQHGGLDKLPDADRWEIRRYGRNVLLIWVKEGVAAG